MRLLVPIGRVPTMRARLPEVVATVGDKLGLGQVCGCGEPGAWVGAVLAWTEHRVALPAQRFGPARYAKRLLGATRCSRYSLPFRSVMRVHYPLSRLRRCVLACRVGNRNVFAVARTIGLSRLVASLRGLQGTDWELGFKQCSFHHIVQVLRVCDCTPFLRLPLCCHAIVP